MPTSPKTAKEIVKETLKRYYRVDDKGFVRLPNWDEATILEELEKDFLSSLHASVEAVLEGQVHTHTGDNPDGCTVCRSARFFNDDPTSPPTPKGE